MKKRGFLGAIGLALGAVGLATTTKDDVPLAPERDLSMMPLIGTWRYGSPAIQLTTSHQVKRKRLMAHNERQRRKKR